MEVEYQGSSGVYEDQYQQSSHRSRTWAGSYDGHQGSHPHTRNRHQNQHHDFMERGTDTFSDDELEGDHTYPRNSRSFLRPDHVGRVIVDLQKKIEVLEQGQQHHFPVGPDPQSWQHDSLLAGAGPTIDTRQVEVIAELHEMTWSNFMNKSDTEKKEYAIEMLMEEPVYRQKPERKKPLRKNPIAAVLPKFEQPISDTKISSTSADEKQLTIPDRIRINSSHILNALATIDKSIESSSTLVMLRPYKFLFHHDKKIRDIVNHLQPAAGLGTPTSMDNPTEAHAADEDSLPRGHPLDQATILRHMQCLVSFMDKYMVPTISTLLSDSGRKVAFRDLWYIFQPGTDIFMPFKDRQHHVSLDPMSITVEMFQGRYERMWRVIGCGGGRPNLKEVQDRGRNAKLNPFEARCYYIDFDGVHFCPVVHKFVIMPYSGERDISSLDFFPVRFLKRGNELWMKSRKQGMLVFEALLQSHTHFYYCGPTLITQPCGCAFQGGTLHQDHIESEVIVDYRATLLKHPSWRPQPSFWRPPPTHDDELQEPYRIRYWNDVRGTELIRMENDQIYNDNLIDKERAFTFKNTVRIFDLVPSGMLSNEKSVPESDVAMLSPRVYAFVLRTRTFAPVWLWGLQKISAQSEGLSSLQLRDNSFKDTIHALVGTHFKQKHHAQTAATDLDYELVRGKGRGLIFLLHGAPGVGKTFTAESVAAANGRPLFQITCGDLGLTPSEVESALKEIFRYAQQWNCVLLLDECDIFLTQRTRNDIKRNSLVSVFLRVLEWYSGVLFLTTNRVGTLDSAVKSRITWSMYYPPLDLTQTKGIWKTNLNLLKRKHPEVEMDKKSIMKFAEDHYLNGVEYGSSWNGRQIQNAFKVAASLADWETLSEDEKHALSADILHKSVSHGLKLTASHFERVATAAETFDDYLMEATGLTEAQRAFNAQERADEYPIEDEAMDARNNSLLQEQVPKKRRTSSMGGTLKPQRYGLDPAYGDLSSGSARRTSKSTAPARPQSRRSSTLQQGGSGTQTWLNSGASKGITASPTQGRGGFDTSTGVKRKRTGSGHKASMSSSTTKPVVIRHSDDTSESEYLVEHSEATRISDDEESN